MFFGLDGTQRIVAVDDQRITYQKLGISVGDQRSGIAADHNDQFAVIHADIPDQVIFPCGVNVSSPRRIMTASISEDKARWDNGIHAQGWEAVIEMRMKLMSVSSA